MCPPYALLILTPDSSLAQRLFDVLARGGAAPRSMQVLTPGELQSGPVGPFDVALVHDGGPDSDAFVAMGLVRRTFKDIPMIVVADTRDDTRMVDLLHAGVADVVWLHNLGRLAPAVERELRHVEGARARDRAEAEVRRLAAIVASAEPAIMSRALDGTVTSWNAGAERLFGFAAEEMMGKTGSELLREAEREQLVALRKRLALGNVCETFDAVRPHKSGAFVDVSLSVSPIREADGSVTGISIIATDITARKRAEDQLRASEVRNRRILDTMSNVVWMSTVGNVVDYVNKRGIELFEIDPSTIEDVDFLRYIHPDDVPVAYALWARSRGAANGFRFECRLRLPDGEYRWYAVEGTPLPEPDGTATRWVGTCTDIHDRVLASQESQRTAELLTAVAAGTPDAFYVKDAEHRYLLVNPAFSRFLGKPVEELLGRTDADLFPPEDAVGMMERDRLVMTTGRTIAAEHRMVANGVTLDLHSTKGPYRDESGRIAGVIGVSRNITDERRALETLRLRERAIEAASQGFLISDARAPGNPIVYVSPGIERITGYAAADFLGGQATFLQGSNEAPETVEAMRAALLDGRTHTIEAVSARKDGSSFWNEISVSPVRDPAGVITHFVGVMTDVTDRHNLEDTYRHAQKMEAVGQLAGGVAHDFNNLLTVINGYSDVLLSSMSHDDPNRELVEEIRQAGQLSSGLTRQLLAFSRKQVLAPVVLDLNEVVGATDKMLRRMIREDIRLDLSLADAPWKVRVDPGQIEQVLMNLAVNARDAMPSGGVLHIDTANVHIAEPGEVPAGEYVRLRVRDTGVGMAPEVSSRIFEPFYTTKEPGHGTGLGLATVYGIVQQSGGQILVQSELGEGTTFDIFLPRSLGAEAASPAPLSGPAAPKGHETVLLVEDEDAVRIFARRVLEAHGFNVLCAADGLQAAAVADTYDGAIELLITDLIMPRVGGREVADKLTRDRPAMRVMFVSGYTDDAAALTDMTAHGVPFLHKPFAADALVHKAREVLDAPPAN
jgi:PAS domain S-box-containing protein